MKSWALVYNSSPLSEMLDGKAFYPLLNEVVLTYLSRTILLELQIITTTMTMIKGKIIA